MQKITKSFLELGLHVNGGLSNKQLTLLNANDIENALGNEITDASAELYVLLKDIDDERLQEQLITNYKAILAFRKKPLTQSTEIKRETKRARKTSEAEVANAQSVTIYCDGGCSPNPGASGSGIALYRDEKLQTLYYGLFEEMGTNNTAELNALYHSLLLAKEAIGKASTIKVMCDSMYSINCIKTWAISWEKNGWKKKGGAIKNLAIIQECYHLYNSIKNDIQLLHVKAHAGLEGNELADRMTHYTRITKERDFVEYEDTLDVETILKIT